MDNINRLLIKNLINDYLAARNQMLRVEQSVKKLGISNLTFRLLVNKKSQEIKEKA